MTREEEQKCLNFHRDTLNDPIVIALFNKLNIENEDKIKIYNDVCDYIISKWYDLDEWIISSDLEELKDLKLFICDCLTTSICFELIAGSLRKLAATRAALFTLTLGAAIPVDYFISEVDKQDMLTLRIVSKPDFDPHEIERSPYPEEITLKLLACRDPNINWKFTDINKWFKTTVKLGMFAYPFNYLHRQKPNIKQYSSFVELKDVNITTIKKLCNELMGNEE